MVSIGTNLSPPPAAAMAATLFFTTDWTGFTAPAALAILARYRMSLWALSMVNRWADSSPSSVHFMKVS